jgi:hypothetical protein
MSSPQKIKHELRCRLTQGPRAIHPRSPECASRDEHEARILTRPCWGDGRPKHGWPDHRDHPARTYQHTRETSWQRRASCWPAYRSTCPGTPGRSMAIPGCLPGQLRLTAACRRSPGPDLRPPLSPKHHRWRPPSRHAQPVVSREHLLPGCHLEVRTGLRRRRPRPGRRRIPCPALRCEGVTRKGGRCRL